MSRPAPLFDRAALALRRARAARAPVDVLQNAALAEIQERLTEVNRSFTDIAVIGPRAAVWAQTLRTTVAPCATLADTDRLDLAPESLDLAVHALALHSADDPLGQLIQMRHALRPDGLMLAACFGGRSLQELRTVLAQTETALRGGLSPRVAPMADIRDLGALLQRAGFALPVADSVTLTLSYPDMFALIRDLRGMGETNVLAARDRRIPPRDFFPRAAALYAADHALAPDRIAATAELVFLAGWKPAPGQQQPLRPGSAAMRLADALAPGARDRTPD